MVVLKNKKIDLISNKGIYLNIYNSLYKMLQILPQEIIHALFELLPITDKRNFTRCNSHLYTKNKLIDNYQNKLILLVEKEYKYVPQKLTPNEKYVIELIYDKYEHLLPIEFICKTNRLCLDPTPFMYFYCAALRFV